MNCNVRRETDFQFRVLALCIDMSSGYTCSRAVESAMTSWLAPSAHLSGNLSKFGQQVADKYIYIYTRARPGFVDFGSCASPRHRTAVIPGSFVAYVQGCDRWSWSRHRISRSASARCSGACARHPLTHPGTPRAAKLCAACRVSGALHTACRTQSPSPSQIARPCSANTLPLLSRLHSLAIRSCRRMLPSC